jgi:hypothetical protein
LGQGRDFVRGHLKENSEILDEMEMKVREFYSIPSAGGDKSAAAVAEEE